jgi:hypothetical protein
VLNPISVVRKFSKSKAKDELAISNESITQKRRIIPPDDDELKNCLKAFRLMSLAI